MIVSNTVSPLWLGLPQDHAQRIAQAVREGLDQAPGNTAQVYFRADDVAVPGNSFSRMLATFRAHDAPLCLAVVPAWLTVSRWAALTRDAGREDLVCWCHLCWRHMNFEPQGVKKREFGQARPARDKRQDLAKGFKRLKEIMGERFTPVFSPPWNRCDGESMAAMPSIGFKGLSRTVGAGPQPPEGLPDFPVLVDLHTRKEPDPAASLDALLEELVRGLSTGSCGIMLHHQRMNETAHAFLDTLLGALAGASGVRFVHFGHLLADNG